MLASLDHRGTPLADGFELVVDLLELVLEHLLLREGVLVGHAFVQFDDPKSVARIAGVIARVGGARQPEPVECVQTRQAARLLQPVSEGLPFGTYAALWLSLAIDQPGSRVSLLKSYTS